MFHNRVTLNDSSLLGGNPPFQPMVTVANGSVDNPGGAGGGAIGPALRHAGPGDRVQAPDGLHVVDRRAARDPRRLRPRRDLRRPSRSLPAARAQHQPAAPGTLQANPGVNIAALRPYNGYGALRIAENSARSIYNSLQLSADRRYTNGLKVGVAYTLGKSEDNASDKRNVLWNTYDDTNYWGPSSFDRTARAERLLHLRPAVLA